MLPLLQSGGGGGSSLATPVSLANGGTHADLSATGGTSQVLRQSSGGANVSVSQLNLTDIAVTAPAAIGFGASGSNSAAAAALVSCTVTINVNDTVVVCVNSSTEKNFDIADDGGNPYVYAGMKAQNSGFAYVFYCVRAAHPATTVFSSMKVAATSGMSILAGTYTNVKKVGAAFTTGTQAATTAGSATMSQTVNNSWIVSMLSFFAGAGTVTAASQGTGTFRSSQQSVNGSTIVGIALVDNTQASAGSLTNKATASGNSNWQNISIELIPGATSNVQVTLT